MKMERSIKKASRSSRILTSELGTFERDGERRKKPRVFEFLSFSEKERSRLSLWFSSLCLRRENYGGKRMHGPFIEFAALKLEEIYGPSRGGGAR